MKRYLSLIASVCVFIAALVMYLLGEAEVVDLGGRHNAYWFFIFSASGIGIVLLISAIANANKYNTMPLAFASFALAGILIACNYKASGVLTVVLCIFVAGYALFALAVILGAKRAPQTKNAQPGYKTYEERKTEEAQLPKEEKPLPEIQSFEDVNKKGEWRE